MDNQQKTTETLREKKIDSIFWTVVTCLAMYIAISGYYYSKRDNDQSQKVLAVAGALSAIVSGGGAAKNLKQYNDIKKELSQHTNEKQK